MMLTIRAPARINLIGEHTDYNQGYVLPCAIDKEIIVSATKRPDNIVNLYSLNFKTKVEFTLSNIKRGKPSWGNYPKGIFYQLIKKGYKLSGMDAVYSSDIPIGAGLSSSASIDVATAYCLKLLNNLNISDIELIKLCVDSENEFVGIRCGIMDQFISYLGKKNYALFINCKNLSYEFVPLKLENFKIVVANTNIKRELVTSEYNLRRQQCEEAVKILRNYLPNIVSLSDVSIEDFEKYKTKLPSVLRKRARHVIYENKRVIETVAALKNNEFNKFGELLFSSHESLKKYYEVSCDELDLLVNIAKKLGAIGSRLVGAGFGGCTISLVRKEKVDEFVNTTKRLYFKKTNIIPDVYPVNITNGASIISVTQNILEGNHR